MARIDTVVAIDTTEVWEVTDGAGRPPQLPRPPRPVPTLRDRRSTAATHLRGPKDTVYIPSGDTVRFALRFSDCTDPDTPYVYHRHFLRHEDVGMMGQFTVVAADDVDSAPRGIDAHIGHQSLRRRVGAPVAPPRGELRHPRSKIAG